MFSIRILVYFLYILWLKFTSGLSVTAAATPKSTSADKIPVTTKQDVMSDGVTEWSSGSLQTVRANPDEFQARHYSHFQNGPRIKCKEKIQFISLQLTLNFWSGS
jgi:hypothetical protein